MMKRTLFLTLVFFALISRIAIAQTQKELLIRVDDAGMSHSTNLAIKELCETGIPFSTSIMFACPWYQEAVELLKNYPHVTVGIHLTLNAEWKNYRWGPVAGKSSVPSLVDSLGYFVPSRAAFDALNPQLDDIERELRAQIERAVSSGLPITYVDYHMGTAVDKPERRALLEKLAKEYRLGISRYFGEQDVESMYSKPVEEKKSHLLKIDSQLQPTVVGLIVVHVINDDNESQALLDLNSFGLANMSKHRQAELNALTSVEFKELVGSSSIRLITYKELINRVGLNYTLIKH